jgi:hypothetical protein
MPQAGFEPMIPVFERPKTVRALDRAANEPSGSTHGGELLDWVTISFSIRILLHGISLPTDKYGRK